jgi:predicted PurR-regulated permease PerM
MDTIIATNFLFYVLSIFIICLTVGFVAVIIYLIKIFKSTIDFLDVIKEESKKITQDIENIKTKISGSGAIITSFVTNILSSLKSHKSSSSAKPRKKTTKKK